MEFIPLVQMAVLVFTVINFLKFVRAGDSNGALTQLSVWVAGVLVTILAAQTDFAGGIVIGDMILEQMNIWSLIFIGLTVGSLGTFGSEIKKAIDNTDSAVKPNLFNNDKDAAAAN